MLIKLEEKTMRRRGALLVFLGYGVFQLWRNDGNLDSFIDHIFGIFAFWAGISGIAICSILGILMLLKGSSEQCSSATQRNSGEYTDTLGQGIMLFIGCCVLTMVGLSNYDPSATVVSWFN